MVNHADVASEHVTPVPERRVVLLGASNLIRGISTVLEAARHSWGSPLDFVAALGHGRSYGMTSCVLGRTLPGIVRCELWPELSRRAQLPTAAIVTDLGNDLLYGARVEHVARWVQTCLQRLAPSCQRLVVTGLPLTSLTGLEKARFVMLRSLLFPGSTLSLPRALEMTHELHHRAAELATQYDATFVIPHNDWFGFDPIHIRMKYWSSAWQEYFSCWRDGKPAKKISPSLSRWWRLRTTRPRERKLFGIRQQQLQPATILADGTQVSFF